MPCYLKFTGNQFVFAGKQYPNVPLLVDSHHRFVEPVCDYFRSLVTLDHLKTSSVKTYAQGILNFWRFLEKTNRPFQSVSDKDLNEWFNEQEKRGVIGRSIAARCDAVFDLYVWLESKKYIQYVVRIPEINDHEKFLPQLSTSLARRSSNSRGSRYGVVSGVRPRASSPTEQATPTSDDLTDLYVTADNPNNWMLTERNHLLIDWYVQVGLRRHEWAALEVRQIPEWEKIDGMRAAEEAFELRLTVTKGSKVRYVGVLPDLLEKTREYIEGARSDLVKRFRKRSSASYREPKEIFLSDKTGLTLNLTSITNLLTHWFKDAGVDGHGHRLRAVFLTNLFEAELVAEESRLLAHPGTKVSIDYELILRKVAERAGHSDIASLRPYLTLARKRRARAMAPDEFVTVQQKIEARRQELAMLEARCKLVEEKLLQVCQTTKSGRLQHLNKAPRRHRQSTKAFNSASLAS